MLQASLVAIRSMLKTTFPDVKTIYTSNVPAGFKRPCFFVGLVSSTDRHHNKAMFNNRITWQIVYFAPKDGKSDPDLISQFEVSQNLKDKLMDDMELIAPNGTVFNILECEGGPRDAEVYITVVLDVDLSRNESTYDLMQDIDHDYKEG